MINRLLNIGLISSLLTILFQLTLGLLVLLGFKSTNIFQIINGLHILFNILILIILWKILVKFFKQSQLDKLLKAIISVSILVIILIVPGFLPFNRFISISLIVLSIINLIFYFIFIFRVMEIDIIRIHQIDQLKNYGLAFVICLFGQLVLSIIIELNRLKGLDYISHLLILIPFLFIGLFFMKIKREIRQNKIAST